MNHRLLRFQGVPRGRDRFCQDMCARKTLVAPPVAAGRIDRMATKHQLQNQNRGRGHVPTAAGVGVRGDCALADAVEAHGAPGTEYRDT